MTIESHTQTIENIRAKKDKDTASDPLHWLNLVGLFWLEEGDNTFGSAETNNIVLPAFPHAECGSVHFNNGTVTLKPAKEITVTFNGGHPFEPRTLRNDRDKAPDLVEVGSVTIKVIIRGNSTLLRIWDKESQAGKDFKGFNYFPIDSAYRITAKYVAYDPPKPTKTLDVIGNEGDGVFLGQAQFTLNGMNCTLEAEKSGDNILFHFDDKTKADSTYGGGRNFSVPMPQTDEIILDFNLAKNWPCAYTPYATCPVTPKENHLPVRIEAGEKKYYD